MTSGYARRTWGYNERLRAEDVWLRRAARCGGRVRNASADSRNAHGSVPLAGILLYLSWLCDRAVRSWSSRRLARGVLGLRVATAGHRGLGSRKMTTNCSLQIGGRRSGGVLRL